MNCVFDLANKLYDSAITTEHDKTHRKVFIDCYTDGFSFVPDPFDALLASSNFTRSKNRG